MEKQALQMVLTLKSGFQLFLKDNQGVTREVASIFPFQGTWVIQYTADAQIEKAFKSADDKGELI